MRFKLVLLALLLLQMLGASFLLALAALHWFLSHPYMTYYAESFLPGASWRLRPWATAFAVFAALELLEIAVAARAIMTFRLPRSSRKVAASARPNDHGPRHGLRTALSPVVVGLQALRRAVGRVIGRRGLLGIEHPYFELQFVLRELLEVVAQIVQLARFASLVARPWTNQALALAVVVDCWSTPVIQLALRGHPRRSRELCVLVDVLLATATSVVVPSYLMLSNARKFDFATFAFPPWYLYNDREFVTLVNEHRFLLVTSTVDGVCKLLPQVGCFVAMRSLRLIIDDERRSQSDPARRPKPSGPSGTDVVPAAPVGASRPLPSQRRGGSRTRALHSVAHTVMIALGVGVLAVHAHATWRTLPDVDGCHQRVSPWFGAPTAVSCAIFEFNCNRRGVPTPGNDSLLALDQSALVSLILSHCTALVVPPALRALPGLSTLEIYNSTVVQWARDAALDADVHRQLSYLGLIRVNLTGLPDGLVPSGSSSLPLSLQDIEIAVANLTTLPDDLADRWHGMAVLYIEHTLLAEFPRALQALHVDDLSLACNAIDKMPLLRTEASYYKLSMACNPLRELPPALARGASIVRLGLEQTWLTALPDWVFSSVSEGAFLWDTPLCRETSTLPPPVECAASGEFADGNFPLPLITSLREP
ncbi:hypothetical protein P43SY_001768 [Pythium insidiosum]|uniref:Uncharacterized protein n=1 Tax=Pythium insidiosum TaxID=114742 RepID=A0AAD5QDQ0_PYTIN|nr:hypothetical protein P43SY_001768 [Pythium insidiosum]